MRISVIALSALAVSTIALVTDVGAFADPSAEDVSFAETSSAAPATPTSADASATDPGPPDEEDQQVESRNLLLAIFAYGLRQARR